jgi:hypothetical protein
MVSTCHLTPRGYYQSGRGEIRLAPAPSVYPAPAWWWRWHSVLDAYEVEFGPVYTPRVAKHRLFGSKARWLLAHVRHLSCIAPDPITQIQPC